MVNPYALKRVFTCLDCGHTTEEPAFEGHRPGDIFEGTATCPNCGPTDHRIEVMERDS